MPPGFYMIILLCLFTRNTSGQCTDANIIETMYVNYEEYCALEYDPCNSNSLASCSKLICLTGIQNCTTTIEFPNVLNCRKACCRSAQDTINQENSLSVKLCASSSGSNVNNEQSSPFIGGYIFIGVICSVFILIFLIFCICKQYRSQQTNLTYPNIQAAQPTVEIPGTCVDLNAYDINEQGPYFVNSKDSCAICLQNQVNLRTHCNHFYHGNCLIAWLKKKINNPCPLCMGIHYNPVKVYCKDCHSGDILVNIHSETNLQIINDYDIHKCQNCKRAINSSFTLSEEGQKSSQNENKVKQIFEKKQQNSLKVAQSTKKQESSSQRSYRRTRKSDRVRQRDNKSAQQIEKNEVETSAKKLHQNHNKTQYYP